VHVAAPAFHDRNGTRLVLAAIRHLRRPCRVVIRAASARSLPTNHARANPRHVDVVIDRTETADYADGWADGDVLVLPRRYGGQSLTMNEAASLGMGVLTLDLAPQNAWCHPDLLVPARRLRTIPMVGGAFPIHDTEPRTLAAAMDRLVDEPELAVEASKASDVYAESLSWDRWASEYRRFFEEIASG
jgi:glycosyltransferase involved in cell wall biosynthesis